MSTLRSSFNWLVEPSLGIADCLQEYQQMRAGSVYWLSIDRHINALRFAAQTLAGLDHRSRAVLVACDKIPAVISALADDQGPAELRSYSLQGELPKAVLHLTEQLDRKLKPVKRLIVCVLPIEALSLLEKNTRTLLKCWRDWCESNSCILLVLAYGEEASRISRRLQLESGFLSGAAYVQEQASGYVYQLDYWINSLGVQGATEFLLQDKNTEFQLVKTPVKQIDVPQGEIFLQRSVLEGAPIFMAEKWRIAEDWPELVKLVHITARGTFVFALCASHELEPLARMLYDLRQQRGVAVTLVVREMKQVLRHQEQLLLQQCGADLVVAAGTHLARFFSLLQNLQSQKSTQPLTDNLEAALAKVRTPEVKGVISVFEFTNYLKTVLASASATETEGILVSMRPVPMLTVAQVLRQLKMLRKGDVACAADGVVYVFLFGCQFSFVEIALQRIFSLPFKDIIAAHQVHSERLSIEDHIRRLQIHNMSQTSADVEQPIAEDVTVDLSHDNSEHTRLTAMMFKPYLKPLQLRRDNELKL